METLIAMYLKWLNEFVTVEKFAEWYWLDYEDAVTVINLWRKYNERKAGLLPKQKQEW